MNVGKCWEWRAVPINEYHEDIPETAIKRAIALKRACPRCAIEVEALSYGPRTADPFLVFMAGEDESERHYLYCWDEPNFKAGVR